MGKRGPKPKEQTFDTKKFQQLVKHCNLSSKPKPPKVPMDHGYDRIPKEVQRGLSKCVICHHYYTPQKGINITPNICRKYWCRIAYKENTKEVK